MSITVVTPDHGINKFPKANYWETMPGIDGDEGNLWIGTAPGEDNAIAEFAKGSWVYVQFDDESGEPRVWSSIIDVPADVEVEDKDGDRWGAESVVDEQTYYRRHPEHLTAGTNCFAPFTEVSS